ncbi:hypothetical protein B0H19DRAFT_1143534, partial [Mycena capillaripes]
CDFLGFRIQRVARILQTWRRASGIRRVLYEQVCMHCDTRGDRLKGARLNDGRWKGWP